MFLTVKDHSLIILDKWIFVNYQEIEHEINQLLLKPVKFDQIIIDPNTQLDSYGFYHFHRLTEHLKSRNIEIQIDDKIAKQLKQYHFKDNLSATSLEQPKLNFVEAIGQAVYEIPTTFKNALTFVGQILHQFYRCMMGRDSFRFKTLYNIIDQAGVQALGIIGLVAFLLGVVLVYQGAHQLLRFGAQIFTINLLAISVLRELGVLITAIIIAGRSGSAFTAEIGFMKLNNEIDAMKVMGINPFNLLVLPRIVGLMIVLPLMVIFANLIALLGGGLLSINLIDVTWDQYWQQLKLAVTTWTLWSGLIKAPFFGFIIAAISCYEGLSVSGGSEDVGKRTTKSVVRSIFIVIVIDALFSVIYAKLGV